MFRDLLYVSLYFTCKKWNFLQRGLQLFVCGDKYVQYSVVCSAAVSCTVQYCVVHITALCVMLQYSAVPCHLLYHSTAYSALPSLPILPNSNTLRYQI